MPDSPAQFARKMTSWSRGIERADRGAIFKLALAAKTLFLTEQRRAAPGGRLRGVGRSGSRIGVRFDIRGAVNPTALIRATGAAHLIERSTKAHEIMPRRRQGMTLPPTGDDKGVRRGRVHHPGTQGKHPWAIAKQVVRRTIPELYRRVHRGEMARHFFGG